MVRLLRLAGPRPAVPDARAARVRATVHQHWQTDSRRRTVRRRTMAVALSLATAALVFLVARAILTDRAAMPIGEVVAVVERIDGVPRRVSDGTNQGGAAVRLAPRDSVRTGEWIETDARARVALRFSDGTSVRLDLGSRARPLSARVIELSAGALYVDTGRTSGQFEVRTPLATARDIGTQFEVRLVDLALRLRVRTGVVELRDGARLVSGRGGTEVTFSAAGAVSRPIAPHGSEWEWTATLSPPLDIEGMPLSKFLERMAGEHVWQLRYADPELGRDASSIVLHGSVDGLSPQQALDVTITTSGLRYRLENGELMVLRGK